MPNRFCCRWVAGSKTLGLDVGFEAMTIEIKCKCIFMTFFFASILAIVISIVTALCSRATRESDTQDRK